MSSVCVALNLAVAAFLILFTNATLAQLVVKIGHVGPLTGAIAHLGRDNELGARLAIEDLNAKSLRIGGQVVRFELVALDDGADPRQAVAAANRLVSENVRGVIGHLNSGTSIPASKIYFEAGIPQISPSSTHPKYTMQGFNTAFRLVANDAELGAVMGRYAIKDLRARRIAIIDDRTNYGSGLADRFEDAVKASGGEVVGREFTNDKATDFGAIFTRLKPLNPDVVFYGGMDAVAGPMIRQMKQFRIDAKFMGGDGICSYQLIQLAGDGMSDGQVICAETGGVGPDKTAALDTWKASFKRRTGVDVQIYAPYTYDATMVMATAMLNANSTDPKKYLPALGKVNYDGLTGRIAFDSKGDILNGALSFYTYAGGKRQFLYVVGPPAPSQMVDAGSAERDRVAAEMVDAERRRRQEQEQRLGELQQAKPQAEVFNPAASTQRLNAHALVIGNGAYPGALRLPNPANDSKAMSMKLRSLGFIVTEVNDANRARLVQALGQFNRSAANADLTLLFYSGHGVQILGTNYILPTDVDQSDVAQATIQGISLNSVVEQFMPGPTKVVFLDACRDNPLAMSNTRSVSRGLAPISVSQGTLIAYATKDGQTALDGLPGQSLSPFTSALLEHLSDPDDIAVVLRKVRDRVMKSTGGKQQPWDYGSLSGGALVLSSIKK